MKYATNILINIYIQTISTIQLRYYSCTANQLSHRTDTPSVYPFSPYDGKKYLSKFRVGYLKYILDCEVTLPHYNKGGCPLNHNDIGPHTILNQGLVYCFSSLDISVLSPLHISYLSYVVVTTTSWEYYFYLYQGSILQNTLFITINRCGFLFIQVVLCNTIPAITTVWRFLIFWEFSFSEDTIRVICI